ncbi:M48 family metalloprotease [Phocaeicola sp.]
MRRSILFLAFILLGCGMIFSQVSRTLSPVMNIEGVFKNNYDGVAKGTPFVMQRIVKLKKAPVSGASREQAVIIVNGIQFGLPLDMLDVVELQPKDKNSFWQATQLTDDLIRYYEKKGYQEKLRKEQEQEADDYLRELEQAKMLYEDAAVEDYLQCMLLSIVPEQMAVFRNGLPQVRVLKSPSPDMLMLGNDCLLISTGMLTTLDTEEELYALMAREVAHYVLDHAIITVNKNIARAKRAQFWGAVANGVVAATEAYLTERYDYYEPGLIFATNDVIQALVNENIVNRMGLDYSDKQEREADEVAIRFINLMGKNKEALPSALTKVFGYYERTKDYAPLNGNGIYSTLANRLKKLGDFTPLEHDRIYLKKTCTVVSFEAGMMDYNKKYSESKYLAMKNIGNNMACSDDYLMVARYIMKQSNTPESNKECLSYLEKADAVAKVTNVNICKMKILLLFRENKQVEAVNLLREYQSLLDIMFRQPHSEEDGRWITEEYAWAEKLLDRTYIM